MATDQQLLAAWVSAAAAVVQAVGAVAAIVVAIRLARDSERRSIEAERAAAEREQAADRAAAARAEAADRAAEERIARALHERKSELIASISILSRELLDEANQALERAKKQFGSSVGSITGGHTLKQMPSIMELIPEWKLAAGDARLAKSISQFEKAIQPWSTVSGGEPAAQYIAKHQSQRDRIEEAILKIEGSLNDEVEKRSRETEES